MINIERIKTMPLEELAEWLCEISNCRTCVAEKFCYHGFTGYLNWLRIEEFKDEHERME